LNAAARVVTGTRKFDRGLGQILHDQLHRERKHNAGSLSWPFTMLKYKHIFQIKYTEAILSNSARKLLWFEITKMLIAV